MGQQLNRKLYRPSPDSLAFWCPGCLEIHSITVRVAGLPQRGGPAWNWNGNVERPTFTPSISIRTGHYASGFGQPNAKGFINNECWCTYYAEYPTDDVVYQCRVCHTFVTDGRIQFLSDCSHNLAGQTVDLPDFPDSWLVRKLIG